MKQLYEIQYSRFIKKYMVINRNTKLAQSFWDTYKDAKEASRMLNIYSMFTIY